ncbi:MAG TPA: RdgB/HAM1 family non-canonical purine NTP pyrophosphatase [Chitinophagaceae bacterium]|nr:RdgB/HAM1 family non-canonical purine NTP pyrophosphatase [Chitinophagaceae bacterium]
MQLIFATNNRHKVEEIKLSLPQTVSVISLKEAGIDIDIPEPFDTLEENAREKGRTISKLTNQNCFSEDTGLEVEALHGAPGVYSARYAGPENSSEKNIEKLLTELGDASNRKAQFRTVIFLVLNNEEYYFEGICTGQVTSSPIGSSGFGYDAIFIPDGASKSFGEMTMTEKNVWSHRQKAMNKLVTFLNQKSLNSTT